MNLKCICKQKCSRLLLFSLSMIVYNRQEEVCGCTCKMQRKVFPWIKMSCLGFCENAVSVRGCRFPWRPPPPVSACVSFWVHWNVWGVGFAEANHDSSRGSESLQLDVIWTCSTQRCNTHPATHIHTLTQTHSTHTCAMLLFRLCTQPYRTGMKLVHGAKNFPTRGRLEATFFFATLLGSV